MLRHIQRRIEEAQRVVQTDDWYVWLLELDVFLAIIYALGAHKATKTKVYELWNRLWAIPIISETTARYNFEAARGSALSELSIASKKRFGKKSKK